MKSKRKLEGNSLRGKNFDARTAPTMPEAAQRSMMPLKCKSASNDPHLQKKSKIIIVW